MPLGGLLPYPDEEDPLAQFDQLREPQLSMPPLPPPVPMPNGAAQPPMGAPPMAERVMPAGSIARMTGMDSNGFGRLLRGRVNGDPWTDGLRRAGDPWTD